ncbi:hypothetical protein CHUAL_001067 [Chamberlinius hualienensis]
MSEIREMVSDKVQELRNEMNAQIHLLYGLIENLQQKDEMFQSKQAIDAIEIANQKAEIIKLNAKSEILNQSIGLCYFKLGEINNHTRMSVKHLDETLGKINADISELQTTAKKPTNDVESIVKKQCYQLHKEFDGLKLEQQQLQLQINKLDLEAENASLLIHNLGGDMTSMSNRVTNNLQEMNRNINVVKASTSEMKTQLLEKSREIIEENAKAIVARTKLLQRDIISIAKRLTIAEELGQKFYSGEAHDYNCKTAGIAETLKKKTNEIEWDELSVFGSQDVAEAKPDQVGIFKLDCL